MSPITPNYLLFKVSWGPLRFKFTRNGLEAKLLQVGVSAPDVQAIMTAVDYGFARLKEVIKDE